MSEGSQAAELFWKKALESARQGVWDYDIRSGEKNYSDTWRQIRGLKPGVPITSSDEDWLQAIHPDDRDLASEQTAKLNAGELTEVNYEYRERHADGHWIWIMCRGRAVAWDDQGRPCRFIGIDTEITPIKASEDRVMAVARRLELALSSVQIGIFVFYLEDQRVEWDWRLRMIYGLPANDAALPRNVWERCLHPEDLAEATRLSNEAIRQKRDLELNYRVIRQSDGAVRHIRSRVSYQEDRMIGPVLIGVNWDITEEREASEALRRANELAAIRNAELEEARARMEYNALHDALTGLPNRRMLDQVQSGLTVQPGQTGARVAMLHIDLDRFKQINDVYGHDVGDFVLCNTASILRDGLPVGTIVARVGGDEFAALILDAPEATELACLAERLIGRCAQPVTHEGAVCRYGISIGIALGHEGTIAGRDLFINADLALYRAKAEGRGRAAFYSEELRGVAQAQKRLSDDILAGIERDEFSCVYQPQFQAADGMVCGVEALVRWNSPQRGGLLPVDFLETADDVDALATIDRIVLTKAARDFARWAAEGCPVPRLSVNLSKARLRDPDLARDLARMDLPFDKLSFELLESNYLDDQSDVVAANLQAIRDLGISIEVDDFGTGHASIVSLLKLKPARLKIDRALVAPIAQSDRQAQLVRSIVEIGHLQGISIIAEGVETEAQRALLVAMGCDELQGFALARPLGADEIPAFMRNSLAKPGFKVAG